ncbi:hypothetical protein ACHAWT_001988 [Skeletonema menzelii]
MTNFVASKAHDIRSCQTKTLALRILQGYEITKTKCTHCGVPLMEYKGNISCVICPQLEDKIEEAREDGGVEIINNLYSGSMLGSMSSSVNSEEHGRNQSFEELDNADVMTTSYYSIESDAEYLSPNDTDDTIVKDALAVSAAKSLAKTEPEKAPPASQAMKNDNTKNVLFMKMIKEMAEKKKEQKEHLASNKTHVIFSQEPQALKSPTNTRKNDLSKTTPMPYACDSPKVVTKRMSINNIVCDDSAKRSYMPAWESKMNSVTKGDFEGEVKMASTDKVVSSVAVRTNDESRDDGFFTELRQKAASKQKVNPFPLRDVDEADHFPKVGQLPMRVSNVTGKKANGDLQPCVARPERFGPVDDVDEHELKLQEKRWQSEKVRKMEEKKLIESMTNHGKSNQLISTVPLDEMKDLTVKCMKEERVPEPFDESNDFLKETSEFVLANTDKLLKSTHEVLGETRVHLPEKKKHNRSETEKVSSSSDSIADSMKEHSQRIVALEAKTLQKYTKAALATTNPNPSSASLRSLSTTEKDKRQKLRGRVLELEAEALRKHSEAAMAALHARQALDKMVQHRKKSTVEKKQSKIEDLSINSSLSTKDETASHPSNTVESASLSQYSGYEYRHPNDDISREEFSVHTPPKERRSRNPPEFPGRTHSSQYHREQMDHSRSRSVPRSRMPPNILLPSLHSASPKHHASPRQSRERATRPHLMPYSPRTTPRRSSQSNQRPFSNRPYSPSPDLYIDGSSNTRHSAPISYKYQGSMTPRTVHEQQHYNFRQNQAASRNFESMMLASNQTVQERLMDQQQPRVVYSDNLLQPGMQRSYVNNNIHYNDRYQERVINPQQPRVVAPEQMIEQQRASVGFHAAHFDPATQHSHLNSPKVQFTHHREAQYNGAANNVQYVDPNMYMRDGRNDYSSVRYDGTPTRW